MMTNDIRNPFTPATGVRLASGPVHFATVTIGYKG